MDITKIEKRLWEKLGQATQAKDAKRVSYYNGLALELEDVKRRIATITTALDAPDSMSSMAPVAETNAVMWEVTDGALKESYLSVTKAVKAGLIDKRQEYEIGTSTQQTFTSGVTAAMLSERAEIKKFYQLAEIKRGAMVKLERRGANKLFLSRIDHPLHGW